MNSGTRPSQREACQGYWEIFLKRLTATGFLGKRFTGANQKPSRNPIKLVGFEEKQFTRTHTSKFLRACRALTALRLCCRAIHLNVGKNAEPVSTKRLLRI